MRPRSLRPTVTALAVGLGTTAALLLSAGPALAVNRDDGDDPGPSMSLLASLGWLVGLPLLVVAVVTGLVVGTSPRRGRRYRPGVGWWAEPVWFHGPAAAAPRTGASVAAEDPGHTAGATVVPGPQQAGGGASARW